MKKNKLLQASRWFLYFMMYSVIGWLYEVFLEVVVYRWGFSNRGVLFGPVLHYLWSRSPAAFADSGRSAEKENYTWGGCM